MNITRLSDEDWGDLLPGTPVTLGKTTIVIQPLGIANLKEVSMKLAAIFSSDKPIDVDSDSGLKALFIEAAEHAPELLELATGLHRDDIAKLPIAKGVELLKAVVEVNMASQESLLKNCKALAEMITATFKANQ